jgi:hypothetical protein
LPYLRGVVSSNRRTIAHWDASPDALTFAASRWAEDLCALGTSCPDHFLRTRISPMFVPWDPAKDDIANLLNHIAVRAADYRKNYIAYYDSFAEADSPKLRDSNPSVVVIPGLGLFGFAKDKREARITTEFFVNAIHVMAGANALEGERDGADARVVPQAKRPEQAAQFASFRNYVALPRLEAFRIEYWALEEAKLQRMPPEREFSRKIALVVGGGSGIGRDVVHQLAQRGAHVVVADLDVDAATEAATAAAGLSSPEMIVPVALDLANRGSIREAMKATVLAFGGLDIVINTAAIYPTPTSPTPAEQVWAQTMAINVSSNHVLAQEASELFTSQRLASAIVLTSSANAVVPKHGSEPYDVKGGDQSPDSRTGNRTRTAGARQRHRAGDRGGGVLDVPARPRHCVTEEVSDSAWRG